MTAPASSPPPDPAERNDRPPAARPPVGRLSLLRGIPRPVLALGVVSLLTDLGSEMIYPLLPLFLTAVLGAGAVSLGIIEGAATAVAALLRLLSGLWSDRTQKRRPLIVAGYSLAAAARPLIGLAGSWTTVLALRLTDRVGKGLRGSPRDAYIADVTPAADRGAAFGVQRAMDHAGAMLGPLVAAALLTGTGISLPNLFLASAIPGVLVVAVLVFAVPESPVAAASSEGPLTEGGPAGSADAERADAEPVRLTALGRPVRRLLAALLLFTLGNSTDAFLLLKLTDAGLAPAAVALLWSAHHAVKMVATALGGRLSDRRGRRPLLLAGWALYAAVYAAFAAAGDRLPLLIAAFLAYGVHFGFTEPTAKAWFADLSPAALRGTAFGAYHATVGLGALPASLLFGLLYVELGAAAAFLTGAALAGVAALLLLRVPAGR